MVQFCSSYPQPEVRILVLPFLLLHCDMTPLVLVTASLLGEQQAHGQPVWAVRTWMVVPQDTTWWPACAPASSPSWWLPMKGSKVHLWIPAWNLALRAKHLKAVSLQLRVSAILLLSVVIWSMEGAGEPLVIPFGHLVEMPLNSAGVLAWSLRTIEGLRHLEHLWAQVSWSMIWILPLVA